MSYRVKLNHFEGPLDLLLFFIKRDQLDIYDIPIAKIAKEFLEYTHIMQLPGSRSSRRFYRHGCDTDANKGADAPSS